MPDRSRNSDLPRARLWSRDGSPVTSIVNRLNEGKR